MGFEAHQLLQTFIRCAKLDKYKGKGKVALRLTKHHVIKT
jgi:hypothetical protein